MAMQGGTATQEKVARLLSKQFGKPILKPNKPLVLKDKVASRKMKNDEATCITELSLLMTCWKQNEFNNTICSSEASAFYRCIEHAQAERREQAKQQALGQGGILVPKKANMLLKRYPNLRKEI